MRRRLLALVAILVLPSCGRQATQPSTSANPGTSATRVEAGSAPVEPASGPVVVDLGIGRRTVFTIDGSLRVTPLDGGAGTLTTWHDVVEHEIVGDFYPDIPVLYRAEHVHDELYGDYGEFWRQDRDGLYRYPVVILDPVPPDAVARLRAGLDARHVPALEAGLRELARRRARGAPRTGEVLVLRYPLRPGTSFVGESGSIATVEGFGWRQSPAGRFRVAHVRVRYAGSSQVIDYGAPGLIEDDASETIVNANVRIEFREAHELTAYVPAAPE